MKQIAGILGGALAAALIAGCAGPRAQLPAYESGVQSAAAPAASIARTRPTGPFDQAAAAWRVQQVVDRLTQAIVAPEMCRALNCPREAYQIKIVDSDTVNAATDGRTVYATRGILQFVDSDGELAAVLSHEIAHALLDHSTSKQQDAMIGAVLGAAVGVAVGVDASGLGANLGALSYSKTYEREADYVGMYVMARAGYGLRDAYTMWTRMNGLSNAGGGFLSTHPAFGERLALIRATNDEIAAKIRTRQPLVPALN